VALAAQAVGPSCQNLYRNTFSYHTITACEDSKQVPLQECVAYLHARAAEGHKVLVYCMTGSSRYGRHTRLCAICLPLVAV
jgi:hypothetical protein